MKKNNLVTKSNDLIEMPLKMSVVELRIIYVLISIISPDDQEFQRYRFKISEFAKLAGVKNKNIYAQVKEYTLNLMSHPFYINENLQVNWLASAEYFPNEGIIEVEFSPKLKPYLLQLKEKFTSFRLNDILKLKSAYSMRIYELLKQYEKLGQRTLKVQRLKELLGIEDQYPVYSDFKKRVITKAQQEINKSTDIEFNYVERKSGRKVDEIVFTIKTKAKQTVTILPPTEALAAVQPHTANRLSDRLKKEFGLTTVTIQTILKSYEKEYITEILDVVKIDVLSGRVHDIPAYTVAALKNDYRKKKTELDIELDRQQALKLEKEQKSQLQQQYYATVAEKLNQYIVDMSQEQLEIEVEAMLQSVADKDIEIITADVRDPQLMSGGYFRQYLNKKYFYHYTFDVFISEVTEHEKRTTL
ncbi:plasmid replication initiation protein [Paenibacillus sp. SORGH_AS306]|uniref:replication initiation protein n=1 Tax=unclassified Paenibacillus TaxID=185978 RepID=UPI00277D2A16|nr:MULTISPECIES: replication initiation protein [unclassified Paenibacillus]MDQ1233639.1 plasmid replication initiation protein [Paenibacillus sp. SORGH_AS_0306]MDR6110681.1 plasmid replication initiation protein [Paenibacillus sp. SORGH_AS_0338]